MIGQRVDVDVANQVLNQFGQGGYPGGSFVTALLDAWRKADPTNQSLLGRAYPGFATAIDLANLPGGIEIDRLKEIAGGQQP